MSQTADQRSHVGEGPAMSSQSYLPPHPATAAHPGSASYTGAPSAVGYPAGQTQGLVTLPGS